MGAMSIRDRETLQVWLDDFARQGYPIAGSLRVITQDGADDADTGLVAVRLEGAPTAIYIEPASQGSSHWVATLDARDESVTLDAAQLLRLSGELAMVSALCGFLQERAQAAVTGRE